MEYTAFALTFKLANDEAQGLGPERAISAYLEEVAEKVGILGELSGTILDGNGNEIGTYEAS